jgi:hypothetical protein
MTEDARGFNLRRVRVKIDERAGAAVRWFASQCSVRAAFRRAILTARVVIKNAADRIAL